jgi:hypothetical protein
MHFLLIAALLSLAACTSSRTWVASPMESKINGEVYHYHNLVVLKDKADMFHATESRSWMEDCKSKIEKPVTQEQWDYPYQDCVRESEYMANVAPSVSQQAVTPIVTTAVGAAGFAAGMHQLGRGIAKSGSRTTNNNSTSSEGGDGGDSSSRSSASAKQNSDNVTKNHNNQTYNNNSKTNINSGNHLGKH